MKRIIAILSGSLIVAMVLAVAAFAVMGYSFVLTLIIALALKYTIGIRITEEQEITGIDQTIHAETAYEFSPAMSGSHIGASAPAPQRVVT